MEQHPAAGLFQYPGRLRHRENGAQLVVHQHHGHQNGVRPQGGGQVGHGDVPLFVRSEVGDLVPLALQLAAGLQHGGVFIGSGDDMVSFSPVQVDSAENGPVVPFGAAGGEKELLGRAAQGGGHIGPPQLDLSGGLAAQFILGGGIAPALLHGLYSGLNGLWANRGGSGIIQIVQHGWSHLE